MAQQQWCLVENRETRTVAVAGNIGRDRISVAVAGEQEGKCFGGKQGVSCEEDEEN